MRIGPYQLNNKLILAPMAGITDRPFREICKRYGAGLTISEMVASNPILRHHKRTLLKTDDRGETGLHAVQIVGTDPQQMAEAALFNAERGTQIIDINMGCPAKKVCSVAAGSALLKNEALVAKILTKVIDAVDGLPVTLKIRTGWDKQTRNAVRIAQIAEDSGIAALTIHGRTRACKFSGQAEYATIKQVKQTVKIPVIANGDINSAKKAKTVLQFTGADAIMIGRSAQGNPWIFNEIQHYLKQGKLLPKPQVSEVQTIMLAHLEELYSFYGSTAGVRIARKHINWYFKALGSIATDKIKKIYRVEHPSLQMALVNLEFKNIQNNRAA